MVNKLSFVSCYAKCILKSKILKGKHPTKKYAGKQLLTIQESNDFIYSSIQSGQPFMAARYGTTELGIIKWQIAQNLKLKNSFDDISMNQICINSGFFPKDPKFVSQFADLMMEKSAQVDLLGALYPRMEDYIIKNFASQAQITDIKGLEPWYVDIPWSRALKGKKVLVIHPFETTILNQYKKRENLFINTSILPSFELKTLKAVQTIAGEKDARFETWFDALNYMYNTALSIDFDIAIIGCGAYGFPLAAKLKEAGKQAIHLGGATQLLFGITGNRWKNNECIQKNMNSHWVSPLPEEKPQGAHRVENSCYW